MQKLANWLANDSAIFNLGIFVAFLVCMGILVFVARRVAQIKTLLAAGEKHYWEAQRAQDAGDQPCRDAAYGQMLETYRKAANLGASEAKTRIGHVYREGLGVTPDMCEAFVWYKKAAKWGVHEAQYHLSQCYEKGLGCEAHPRKAKYWHRRSQTARLRIGF